MARDGDAPAGSGDGAEGYVIAELAWPGSSGLIGLAPCPGVRAGRFRPERLAPDLDEMQRWGAAAMLCLILEGEIEALSVDRLVHDVRRRGIGCVQLHGTGQGHGIDLDAEWPRVRDRLVQALRSGQRLLIPCAEGEGRTGPVAAWLMIEGGASPDAAIAAVRAAFPGTIETAEQDASVRAYVPRA